MKKFVFFLTVTILASLSLNAQILSALPFDSPLINNSVRPLSSYADDEMTRELQQKLFRNAHWKNLITNKKMAVTLVDMRDPYHPHLAAINGNEMMYAASLPKIAILLAAMDAIDKGELEATKEVKADLRIMISKSSNHAATRMIDRLGYDKIARVLTDPKYSLYDEDKGGGLWVGKRYARSGERNPDPMKGLSHAATTNQVARFYFKMAHGQLVNPEKSSEMLKIMHGPELHHKFVNTLRQVAPSASIFRKSGSWSTFHSDSAMVWDNSWRRYILVALIDDPNGESICRQLVKVAEEVIQSNLSTEK